MLPTYPSIVAQRTKLNRDVIKQKVKTKSPILADIASHLVHEGERTDLVRTDGRRETTEILSHSSETEIKIIKINDFTLDAVANFLDNIATQFAEQMSRNLFETVSASAASVGNVVDGKGRPLSPELLLEAFERIDLDFDADGTWNAPTIVVSPQQFEKIKEMEKSADAASYEEKLANIIERKRLEHRSREAGRVLAG